MTSQKSIGSFFKKKEGNSSNQPQTIATPSIPPQDERPSKCRRIQPEEMNVVDIERDPGLRPMMWEFPFNQRDEIRRAYLKVGPYQPRNIEFPFSGEGNNRRRFQASWFDAHSYWLEYSPKNDAIYCLPCYLFGKNEPGHANAFIVDGFCRWKKVNEGVHCPLLVHVGKNHNSSHRVAVKSCEDLKNQSQHIQRLFGKQASKEVENNRLRLKATIDSIRWLTSQACAFRGNDESFDSKNRGNFIELLKFLATYNDKVASVVLENAPQNATYTSPKIQKEILQIIASKVRNAIRKEIGDVKFCILIDEARDESKREQMAIILRFVDKDGFVRERFFHVVHVKDTMSSTLKNEVCAVLSRYDLHVENIRGQGYDGASNMRGEWNGLQSLFLKECPYAYYVHCMAHRLQLALVTASREVKHVHQFFESLTSIINVVGSSSKRHDELQDAQALHIQNQISNNEIETKKGGNQIGTLQRAGDTRWGSHYQSIYSLLRIYAPICSVLNNISERGANYAQRGDAEAAFLTLTSFDFVFILHLMKQIMEITNLLCKALQQQSQDIVNAMHLVSTTKSLLQKLREDGWEPLFESVTSFCTSNAIDIPDLNSQYIRGRRKPRHKNDDTSMTMEHYFKYDIFTAAIDFQLQELNARFCDKTVELLMLSSALSPKEAFKSFKVDDICKLVEKYYPKDFTDQEKIHLRIQLQHYELDVLKHFDFQEISTLCELCRVLSSSGKSTIYHLVDRVIRLVLTLPISTATTERAFSAMKLVKTRLRNKMEDDFLADTLEVYIEKDIAKTFTTEEIMEEFYQIKNRRRT